MAEALARLVDGPGWVDHSTNPIMGLFPLAVEQFLNAAVAVNAPGVTTVTNTARYYALHPLIADESHRRGFQGEQAIDLLRRVEVVYGLLCMSHQGQPGHNDWYPAPHGRDRLLAALGRGSVDVAQAAGTGDGRYANARTGFLGPYVGSEQTLGLLGPGPFSPGPAYNRTAVQAELGAVIDLALSAKRLDLADLTRYGDLCLCQAATSTDGELLASRFAGRPNEKETVAGNIGQIMRLFAVAMLHTVSRGPSDIGKFVMYDSLVTNHPQSTDHWLRWRGIRMRMASVHAWKQLFAHVCRYLRDEPKTVAQLGEQLASELPSGTVGTFLDELPPVVDPAGEPLPAEVETAGRPAPESHLATLALGAKRFAALDDDSGPVRLGFVGPPGHRFMSEELSPRWCSHVFDAWRSSSMTDFAQWLTRVMVNRAHRVTMAKSRTRRDARYIMPLRIFLQDDLVVRLWGEATSEPPLRWAQLLSMGRQTGIFQVSEDGRWEVGPRGYFVA